MKYLLDVNLLLAAIWVNHSRHAEVFAWLPGRRAINAPMNEARTLLERFLNERSVERIPDDLPALEVHCETSEQVTDHYLAELAARHGLKLATLDRNLSHANAEVIG